MAIYTQKEKYENPRNLGFESSLAPIDLKYSALTDAVDAYSQMQDKAEAREQKNFDSFKTHYDALTSIPLDNEQQRDKFQEVRKRHGIGDDAFSEIALDPSNPRSVAKLERGFGRLSTDRDFQEILQEQQRAAAYMNGTAKITDPGLQAEAIKDYERYRNGEKGGNQLNISQYEKIDINDIMAGKLAKIPFTISQDLIDNGTYVKEIKARGAAAIGAVIDDSMRDPKFQNNMIAQGYAERGEDGKVVLTESGEQYKQGLVDTYTAEQEKLIQQKQAKALTGTAAVHPGNSFTASTKEHGYYNTVADVASQYGVNMNDPGVQQFIKNKIQAEESLSDTGLAVAIAKGTAPLRAIYDQDVSVQGAGQWPTYEAFQAAVKRGDAAAMTIVDAALNRTGMSSRRQAVITDADNKYTPQVAGGPAAPAQPAGSTQPARGSSNNIPGGDPNAPFQTGGKQTVDQIAKQSAQQAAQNAVGATAPSTAGKVQIEVKDKDGKPTGQVVEVSNIAAAIIGPESGGKNIANPTPGATAAGLGQFIDSTWKGMVKKHLPWAEGWSDKAILALRSDPALNAWMTEQYTINNASQLSNAGVPVTGRTLYMAHGIGGGGATAVMKAYQGGKQGMLMKDLYKEKGYRTTWADVVKINPQYNMNTTVEDVYKHFGKKMKDLADAPYDIPQQPEPPRPATSGGGASYFETT